VADFRLEGGLGANNNYAKIGVSISNAKHLAFFGDMNQQGWRHRADEGAPKHDACSSSLWRAARTVASWEENRYATYVHSYSGERSR